MLQVLGQLQRRTVLNASVRKVDRWPGGIFALFQQCFMVSFARIVNLHPQVLQHKWDSPSTCVLCSFKLFIGTKLS
ncbi:hypothetical protein DUNSADRAFT_8178 [Dunaliella salina]|uniref:Uncharacterized protein n=1 Tax=Dunaliella salina TaxID=3046 RepID=A0ABQ7GJY0_DUNSA|nr:hypothetical protein DUNSADRAFT_8178 [Dunaliella salina]|eukprot:KAF5834907.1 hypothetical protein DUNSADRAFT_8178 [Dunaliella salina]